MPLKPDIKKEPSTDTLLAQLQQAKKEQALLLGIGNQIAVARNKQHLWEIITDEVLNLFGAKYYTLCLINEDGKTHSPFLHSQEKTIFSRTKDSPIVHKDHPIEDGIFDAALTSEKPLLFQLLKLIRQKNVPAFIIHWYNAGIQEMMVVRIMNGNEARGVLYLYADTTGAFTEATFHLLSGIANQIGTGICNILANEKIERQLEEIEQYKKKLEQENLYLQQENNSHHHFSEIVGTGPEMQAVFRLVKQVATADATVLLLGETGTGKELIARAIHNASHRKDKLMIKVNCAALPANLIESELFGHERGSFTGATDRRIGKFELANNSTLFLDEIGELPLELQAKLLRAIQEKEIERLGGKGIIKINVRIVAATNRNLEKEVTEGRFRSDLYYRLNVFPIELPPLRNRKNDIPVLAQHFIQRFAKTTGRKVTGLSAKALSTLQSYSFPGNVRELEHLLERSVLLAEGAVIHQIQLPKIQKTIQSASENAFTIKPLAEMEKEYLLAVVKACNGRIFGENGAAAKLKIPGTTLISKMQKLGIKKEHFASTE
jgi:formate hydrogenlyase transcriptional activator